MTFRKLLSLSLLLSALTCFNLQAAPSQTIPAGEVTYLLNYLEQSNCRFERNGSWYDAHEARAHLEKN